MPLETLDPSNPFAQTSTLEYQLPDFAKIGDEHYLPAFYAGFEGQSAEIQAIIDQPEVTFANTIVALEQSGQLLKRVSLAFFNLTWSDSTSAIQAIESEISPKLTAHTDSIYLNPALFARVQCLYEARTTLGLDSEDLHLLEIYYKDFIHAGAHLEQSVREQIQEINKELSILQSEFSQKLMEDSNELAVAVENVAELDGLSDSEIASCATAAHENGHPGKYLIPAVNFTGHPLLASLRDRGLRQRIMENSLAKGLRGNSHDTREGLVKMATLRAKRAKLFGFATHAEYSLNTATAKTPANVHEMLRKIAPAAVRNAKAEAAELQAIIGDSFELASWDWDFYTEQVRKAKYDLDTELMRPYFELESVLKNGVFYAAKELFGLEFKARPDLVAYHPEARVFEVFNEDGSKLALYIADFYARPTKRGGAWMNNLVDQNYLLNQLPVVVNNLNLPKPAEGEATLLSLDNTTTLFHEFGHALHGMLSAVKYPRTSGTSVERDFVEFPSQVNEMWILWPEVVSHYARHHQTGEVLPQEWIDRLKASTTFNEGHATTSYLAAAVLDLAWHEITEETVIDDVAAFEAKAIADYGLDFAPVPTRYRSTYFSHIFAGGYSAGYYGYIWSEVLDADTVEWFKENGGLTRANGDHFRNALLSRGGSIDSMAMFANFRGRAATIEPLLTRRGLN